MERSKNMQLGFNLAETLALGVAEAGGDYIAKAAVHQPLDSWTLPFGNFHTGNALFPLGIAAAQFALVGITSLGASDIRYTTDNRYASQNDFVKDTVNSGLKNIIWGAGLAATLGLAGGEKLAGLSIVAGALIPTIGLLRRITKRP